MGSSEPQLGRTSDRELSNANEAVQEAIAAAESAANPGRDTPGPAASARDTSSEDPGSPGAAPST
jgi:hypothetical protein